jgi:hypothetical protein
VPGSAAVYELRGRSAMGLPEFEVYRGSQRLPPEQAAESALDLEHASLPPVLAAQERDYDGLGLGSEHARLRLDMRPELAAAVVRRGDEDPGIDG